MHGRFLLKINLETVQQLHLKVLLKKQKKPDKIWSDRGKVFYNKTFLDFLKQNEFQIYSTNSDLKAVFVERFNRTLLDLIKNHCILKVKLVG